MQFRGTAKELLADGMHTLINPARIWEATKPLAPVRNTFLFVSDIFGYLVVEFTKLSRDLRAVPLF